MPLTGSELEVPLYVRLANGTIYRAGISSSGGGMPSRTTAVITTASLANNADEVGTKAMANGYRLYRIDTSAACRVRIYTSAAKRDADRARAVGADPTGDHGLMLEYLSTASLLAADLSPTVDGFVGTPADPVPWTITNASGGTATITVTLTYVQTEA